MLLWRALKVPHREVAIPEAVRLRYWHHKIVKNTNNWTSGTKVFTWISGTLPSEWRVAVEPPSHGLLDDINIKHFWCRSATFLRLIDDKILCHLLQDGILWINNTSVARNCAGRCRICSSSCRSSKTTTKWISPAASAKYIPWIYIS